jgi:hypothetical protein
MTEGCCDLCERPDYLTAFRTKNGDTFYLCSACKHDLITEGDECEEYPSPML